MHVYVYVKQVLQKAPHCLGYLYKFHDDCMFTLTMEDL